mmetsp:Transcript_9954/g.24031  ORF Transcript_9954/g.24031 Transcript_9954/m.24031 type:complete len:205 (-) Transcript_9954:8-622(-)
MLTPSSNPLPYQNFQFTSSWVTVARTSIRSELSLRASSTSRRIHRSPASACLKEESHTGTHHSIIIRIASTELARDSSEPTRFMPERSTRSAAADPFDLLWHDCIRPSICVAQSTTTAQFSVCAADVERPSTCIISDSTAARASGVSSGGSSMSEFSSSSNAPPVPLFFSRSRKSCFFFCSSSRRSPAARFSCSEVTRSATCEA